jgi:hypothetical protein
MTWLHGLLLSSGDYRFRTKGVTKRASLCISPMSAAGESAFSTLHVQAARGIMAYSNQSDVALNYFIEEATQRGAERKQCRKEERGDCRKMKGI